MTEWKHLDLNYKIVARIDPSKCIGCDLCYIACWDGAHQCIHHEGARASPGACRRRAAGRASRSPPSPSWIARGDGERAGNARDASARVPHVDEEECVGCNLCSLVCPVESCITMEQVDTGMPKESWEQRTAGRSIRSPEQE